MAKSQHEEKKSWIKEEVENYKGKLIVYLPLSSFRFIACTTSSSRAPKHIWTNKEEAKLVECLVKLVSSNGWRSDNGTFRLGYLAQVQRMMAEKLSGCNIQGSHPAAKGLLNKTFPYYDDMTYVFGKDRTMEGRSETFAGVGSNVPWDSMVFPLFEDPDDV
ncbi:retrotransposon protein [Cucumis melo var. makuwa]|uniref:Retrotransposon protein n=1 Tax=Cucumis melo var. makuwa TaxID=1194695 RepID=A0A5D3D879_CUCMM|nr:retrotransposon protein [Cucumis melo var. makuwa]